MHWILFLFLTLAFAYAVIMALYAYGWSKTAVFELPKNYTPQTSITVIVPARNEASNIEACLTSILANDYPPTLWEIIVVDDHSEDETAEIVQEVFRKARILPTGKITPEMQLLSLAALLKGETALNSFKKKGIEKAIEMASGALIVTTDADCIVQHGWLRYLAAAHETQNAEIIAAPVLFHKEKGILQCFQSLDFLGMMGITAAGIHLGVQRMANGANLAYTKAVFEAVGGFQGIDSLASGDDMLLMQKVAKHKASAVFFLKNKAAATATPPAENLSAFIQQRIRWASKSGHYPEPWVTTILILVFLFCWSILICGVCAVFWPADFLVLLLILVAVKVVFDYFFLRMISQFFGRAALMRWFTPSFLLHTVYIAFIGLASQIQKEYQWKGRKVQ